MNKPTIIALHQEAIESEHEKIIINKLLVIGYTDIKVCTVSESEKIYDKETMDMIVFKDYSQFLEYIPAISGMVIKQKKLNDFLEKRASWKKKMQGLTNRKIREGGKWLNQQ